jgi:hypothetical protein
MVHLFGLSLAQQILIALGAISQVGAYYLYMRECAHARLVEEAQRERELAEAEAARREAATQELAERNVLPKIVRYRRHVEGVMEHVPEDVRPSALLRTAKVRFKHSLEPYQGETQGLPPIRREGVSPVK